MNVSMIGELVGRRHAAREQSLMGSAPRKSSTASAAEPPLPPQTSGPVSDANWANLQCIYGTGIVNRLSIGRM